MRKQVGLLLLAIMNLVSVCIALMFIIVGFVALIGSLEISEEGLWMVDVGKVSSIAALFGAGVFSLGIHLGLDKIVESIETAEERELRLRKEDQVE